MPTPENPPKFNATEIMIKALEGFGEDEPEALMVIYTNKEQCLKWITNGRPYHEYIGMIEMMKHHLLTDDLTVTHED